MESLSQYYSVFRVNRRREETNYTYERRETWLFHLLYSEEDGYRK